MASLDSIHVAALRGVDGLNEGHVSALRQCGVAAEAVSSEIIKKCKE